MGYPTAHVQQRYVLRVEVMPPAGKSIGESKFAMGMDCRKGVQGENLQSFRELINMVVSEDGTLETRDPCRKMNGALSSLAQGIIVNGGLYYTIARKGDTVTHTGTVATFVSTLYFDPPENVGTTWTLVAYKVFQNRVVAWIRHTFPGTTITTRLYQHVWDSLVDNPTYIADPAGTWDWGPAGFPVNAYGSGVGSSGQWTNFSPVIEPAAEKMWASRIDRNISFSGISRPRIWNSSSATTIEKLGAMYYFTVPTSATAFTTYAIPETYSDFSDYQKFAGYVLEKLNADGSWTKITESLTAPTSGQYQLISTTRTWSTKTIAAIYANGLTVDTLIRFRVLMTPEVVIVSGATVSPGSETYRGDGSTVQWPSTVPFAAFSSYSVLVNSVIKPITTYYTVTNSSGIARVDFNSFSQVTDGRLTQGILTAGSGYTSLPAIALFGGTGGSGSITATSLKALSSTTVAAGGAGYTNGDILTLVGDTGTAAQLTATVAAGIVTAVTPFLTGALTTVAGNPHATTGGTGAGCTLNVLYGINAVSITSQGWVTAPTANVTGGGGAGGALTLILAAPVGITSIPYAASIDGDFGRLSVYYNGLKKTETTDYVLSNNAGNTTVTPTTGLAVGTTLNARLVVPLDTLIQFTAPTLALSAGTITYEQVNQTSPIVAISSLAASSSYYVAAAANGVTNFKPTSAAWTGLERYQLHIVGTVTTDGSGNISATTLFKYGNQALTAWYNARHQLNLDYWAGVNEGGFINSGTHDNSGNNVTSMVAVKNRMAIFYQQSTQLWQVDPVPTNCAFIDRYAFGSRYDGVNFYSRPLIYTQKGFRAFDLEGLNFQSLSDVNIGEPIQQIGKLSVRCATFWPWRGSYIAACTLTGSALYAASAGLPKSSILYQSSIPCFIYLSFSKESGISAWSLFTVAGLTAVDTMIASDGKVYCLQGKDIWYFDNEVAAFTDGETGQLQPQGSAAWHLVPLGGASKSVRLLHVDMIKQGKCQINTSMMPWNATNETQGPTMLQSTNGAARVPLRSTGRAAGIHLLTTDPAGVSVQSVAIEYIPLGR